MKYYVSKNKETICPKKFIVHLHLSDTFYRVHQMTVIYDIDIYDMDVTSAPVNEINQ